MLDARLLELSVLISRSRLADLRNISLVSSVASSCPMLSSSDSVRACIDISSGRSEKKVAVIRINDLVFTVSLFGVQYHKGQREASTVCGRQADR